MKNRLRTKILSSISTEKLKEYCDVILEKGSFQMVKKPSIGLIMMRAKESVQQSVFNIGEILVTECTVKIDNTVGYGVVSGREEERAKYLAILDAIFHSDEEKWYEVKSGLEKLLNIELKVQEKMKIKEFSLVNKTKIDFHSMDE